MPPIVTQSLHLEDTLEENPQTKAMLDLFEKDTASVRKFSKAFASTCQKILNAQVMMISANHELAYYLRLYSEQNFPLNKPLSAEASNEPDKPDKQTSTLTEFADYVDEVTSCFQVFATHLDGVVYPLNKMAETDFDEISTLSSLYKERADEQEQAIQKYLRLPNKIEYDQQRHQVNEEVFEAKKKFHETSMNYFTSLNMLQYKKEYMLIEPMISMMQGLKVFFKMGNEAVNDINSEKKLDGFLERNLQDICKIKEEMSSEMNKNNQMIELLQQDDSIYQAEQPDFENLTTSDSLQKCGFLNLRSKFPLIFKWDRVYYFIQNGCLMHQPKNEIAGSVFLELKSDVTVSKCEIDDLKFTFQINSQFPKKTFYFQANNERERSEWVAILENAIKDDNKSKLQNYMNNNALMSSNLVRSESIISEPKFELDNSFLNAKANKISKPQQGDLFKTRFYGSVNVKADKGNEYIHETIRQVMASRAKLNNFKMTEYNLIINLESLSLFCLPESDSEPKSEQNRDLLKARFDISDLAFWASHKENPRLFGFIIKDRQPANVKFLCLVFESDVNSSIICNAITNSAKLAYQLLVDEKREDHFKKMKKYERDILLQNINGLPDKQQSIDQSDQESDEALLSVAVNSPNPNFIVLDKEMLEYTLDLDSETIVKRSDKAMPEVTIRTGETGSPTNAADESQLSKASNESDA